MTTAAMKAQQRNETVATYRRHDSDTGSTHVQIALLTKRINHINEHMKKNKKDYHTQRGLLKLVGQRNRLLKYMRNNREAEYKKLIAALGLRK